MTMELISKSEIAREKNFSLRDNLHIECYYERALDFDEVPIRLDDLKYYIDKIEEIE
jgi:hypothetical protein